MHERDIMRNLRVFISSFLAGIIFAIGGIAHIELVDTSKWLAALVFAGCLWVILTFDFRFFTGKAGYLLSDSKRISKRFVRLVITLIGNFAGVAVMVFVLRSVYSTTEYKDAIHRIIDEKVLDIDFIPLFIGAIICGMLLYLATSAFIRTKGNASSFLVVLFAATAIIVCGFGHSITTLFHLGLLATKTTFTTIGFYVYMAVLVAGNALGAVIFYLLDSLKKPETYDKFSKASSGGTNHKHHHHNHSTHHSHSSEEGKADTEAATEE